jgi:ATP-binding cassette subfamily F protein uup
VRTLSGGERNRLLLARLFALPANVLVLDEPTNDLDIDTLDLLEELLQGYAGTVFLVSHDRALPRQRGHEHAGLGGRPRLRRPRGPVARVRGRLRGLARAARPRRSGRRRDACACACFTCRSGAARSTRARCHSARGRRAQAQLQGDSASSSSGRRAWRRWRPSSAPSTHCWPMLRSTRSEPQRAAALHARHAQIEEELLAGLERWEALAARA